MAADVFGGVDYLRFRTAMSGVSIRVSGESVVVASGIAVQMSGATVMISGQGIALASGVSVQMSGAFVIISGQGVALASGVSTQMSGAQIRLESGEYVISQSGIGVVPQSGAGVLISGQTVDIGTNTTIFTDKVLVGMISGGIQLTNRGVVSATLKAPSWNSGDIFVGGADLVIPTRPYSGFGMQLEPSEAISLDVDNPNRGYAFAEVSGDEVLIIGVEK